MTLLLIPLQHDFRKNKTMEFSDELIARLREAKSIAALTGAGISAESGVPTFRDPGGLWSKFKPEELANFDAFWSSTELVWGWYQHRRDIIGSVAPNPGHFALVELEKRIDDFQLITQNVDSLHRRAGSENVIEIHGNIMRSYCIDCGVDARDVEVTEEDPIPLCKDCGGKVRPGVVWFGENLPEGAFEAAAQAAENCDVFFSIGTSSVVYPAAALPGIAKDAGAFVIEVNQERTEISHLLDETLLGPSGVILPALMQQAFES